VRFTDQPSVDLGQLLKVLMQELTGKSCNPSTPGTGSVHQMGNSQTGNGGNFKEVRVVLAGMPAAGAKSLATRFTSNVWLERPPPGTGWEPLARPFERIQLLLLPVGSSHGLWEHIAGADVLAFVVDADSFDEVHFGSSFNKAVGYLPEGAPVILLVNKVDADPEDDSKEARIAVASSSGADVQARCSAAAASCTASSTVRQCKAYLISAKTGFGSEEAIRAMCGVRLIF